MATLNETISSLEKINELLAYQKQLFQMQGKFDYVEEIGLYEDALKSLNELATKASNNLKNISSNTDKQEESIKLNQRLEEQLGRIIALTKNIDSNTFMESLESGIIKTESELKKLNDDITTTIANMKKLSEVKQQLVSSNDNKTIPTVAVANAQNTVNNSSSNNQQKTNNSGLSEFQKNEEHYKVELKDTMTYQQQAESMLRSLINSLMKPTASSANIGEYFRNNSESYLPFGLGIKENKVTSTNEAGEEIEKVVSTEVVVLKDLAKQIGDEYTKLLEEVAKAINDAKNSLGTINKNKSALNSSTPNRYYNPNTDSISKDFENFINVSQTKPSGEKDIDYIERTIGNRKLYFSSKGIPETKQEYEGDATTIGRGLFDKSIETRLLGFNDGTQEVIGYRESTDRLNNTIIKLVEEISRVVAFIPQLSAHDEIINSPFDIFDDPNSNSGLGQDILRRITFNDKSSQAFYGGQDYKYEKPSEIPIGETYKLSDLKQSVSDTLKSIDEKIVETTSKKFLPEYDDTSMIAGKNITKALYDSSMDDFVKSVINEESKKDDIALDGLSDEEKEAAKAVNELKNSFRQASAIIDEAIKDTQTTTGKIPETGRKFYADFEQNKTRGGETYEDYKKARNTVDEFQKRIPDDIELSMKRVRDIMSSGNLMDLYKKNEFTGVAPIEEVKQSIIKLLKDVATFSQGEYGRASRQLDKTGNAMFNPEKYIEYATKVSKELDAISKSDAISKFRTNKEQLINMSETIKREKAESADKALEQFKKDTINNLMQQSINKVTLDQELRARERASASGLMSGADLENNNNKIKDIQKQIEQTDNALKSIQNDITTNNFDLQTELGIAEKLKDTFLQVANAVGSTREATQLLKNTDLTAPAGKLRESLGKNDAMNELLNQDDFIKQLRAINPYKHLINGGIFESELTNKVIDTSALKGDTKTIAEFNNEANKELINLTRSIQAGGGSPLTFNNKKVDELNEGISKAKSEIDKFNDKIKELESKEIASEELYQLKSKAKSVTDDFNELKNKNSGGDIGSLRLLFESASKVKDKFEMYNHKLSNAETSALFSDVKRYVPNQEALGNKLTPQQQADYYTSQLGNFKQGTQEYIEVLKLKNAAIKQSEDIEKKAAEDATRAAQEHYNKVIKGIQTLSASINNAINTIISIIRKGISLINGIIRGALKIIDTIKNTIGKIISLFGNLGNRVRSVSDNGMKVTGTFNLMKGSATELLSKIRLLQGVFNQLFNNDLMKRAQNLLASIYSLKNISGYGVTQDVIDWANSMERAFGLSAKDLIGDINELTGVLYGLGMTSKDVAIGSENLLMISRYLAFMGAAGGDVGTVMNKLVSGMKGMTQAIDDLGLSVREAQMDTFLKSIKEQGGEFANISTSFSRLNEQARVYVRYASLIKQFTDHYDITDFVDALDTMTGRMSILKQTASSLASTIGLGFYKLASELAQYVIPIIKMVENAIQGLFDKLFKLLGLSPINWNMSADMNDTKKAADKMNSSLDDTNKKLDETADKANKAGNNLQGFDRINNVTSSKSGSGSNNNNGADNFDYSKLMTTMLDELNAMADAAQESYFDKLQKQLEEKLADWKKRIFKWFDEITGRKLDFGFDFDLIKGNLKKMWKDIKYIVSEWGKFIIATALKIADDLKIGRLANLLSGLGASLTGLGRAMTDTLIPAFTAFYDNGLNKVVEWLGVVLADIIVWLTDELDKWADWFIENSDTIISFFTELGKAVAGCFEILKPFLESGLEDLEDKLSGVGDNARSGLLDFMTNFNSEEAIANFDEFFNGLLEKIDEVKKKLEELKEKFEELKEKAKIAFDDIKENGIDAKSLDPLNNVLKDVSTSFGILTGLKIGSWLLGIIGSISELGPLLAALSGPAGIILGIVAGLSVVFADLITHSETFRNDVSESISTVGSAFKELFKSLQLDSDTEGIGGLIHSLRDVLGPALGFIIKYVASLVSGTITGIANIINLIKPLINFLNVIIKALASIPSFITNIDNSIKSIGNNFISNIQKDPITTLKGIVTLQGNDAYKKYHANSAQKITHHASGGSIAGGQLFIANEHGGAELIGNIDGTSRTNVANNSMIIDAMRQGVFEATYNAMAAVENQRGVNNNITSAPVINLNGFGLIKEDTLREMSRIISPYLNGVNKNIANYGFSI